MKTNRFTYVFLVLGLAALACNNLPALAPPSIQTLQAHIAATQTLQARPEATRTPKASAKITPTPSVGIEVTQSPLVEDLHLKSGLVIGSPSTTQALLEKGENLQLLEGLAKEQYDPKELSQAGKTYTYTIQLDKEQSFLWGSNWCATTEEILRDNFQHISFEFSVEDTLIAPSQFLGWETTLDNMPCRLYYTVVQGWPSGTTHLQVKVTFDQLINDGNSDFPAGTHYYRYAVTRP